MKKFEHYSPTKIVFGVGKLKEIDYFVTSLLAKTREPKNERILIVTGRHSSKANGALDLLKNLLQKKKVFLFDEVEQNPSTQTVDKGAEMARKEKINLVIGLGGGSPMDTGKCIALLATNDGLMEDYLVGSPPKAGRPPIPIIAVPTTAGTGSEVNPHAVIVINGHKKGYSNPGFFPKVAILDPNLTISMPREVTVNTGIDAFTHAIEGYLSTRATPGSDSLAIKAIEIIKNWLPRVVANGKDIEARSNMLYASMIAGLVISRTGTIILHALSYSLTTFYGVPHGRATGALLPWVLEFLKDVKEEKITKITHIIGDVNDFLVNLGIATKLKDYGVTEDDISRFIQDVWGRRNLKVTPKEVTQKDIENIYRQAI